MQTQYKTQDALICFWHVSKDVRGNQCQCLHGKQTMQLSRHEKGHPGALVCLERDWAGDVIVEQVQQRSLETSAQTKDWFLGRGAAAVRSSQEG